MLPLDYLTLHLQPDAEPALTDAEMLSLVELAKRADSSDRSPDDADWVATYNYPAAIAAGWAVKAAKVVGNYQFSDSYLSLHREQVLDHCLKMQGVWLSKNVGSMSSLPDWLAEAIENGGEYAW